VQAGKVAHVGLSNFGPARLREAIDVTARDGLAPISVLQPQYNLLDRSGFEDELQGICVENHIAVVPFYGLAMGFLSGKYSPDSVPAEVGTPRAKGAMKVYGSQDRAWATLDVARRVAAARGAPVAAVALAWLKARDGVVAPIASARNVEQLDDLLPMAGLELTAQETDALRSPEVVDVCSMYPSPLVTITGACTLILLTCSPPMRSPPPTGCSRN